MMVVDVKLLLLLEQDVGGLSLGSELLYGMRFLLKLKGAVCQSYVRPAMLYENEALCLKDGWGFYE